MRAVARRLLINARANAKRRGVPFALTLEWVEQHLGSGVREVTGIPFHYIRHMTRLRPLAPALDRRVGYLGYIADNCRIVCKAFNLAKGDFPESVFAVIAREYLRRNADS